MLREMGVSARKHLGVGYLFYVVLYFPLFAIGSAIDFVAGEGASARSLGVAALNFVLQILTFFAGAFADGCIAVRVVRGTSFRDSITAALPRTLSILGAAFVVPLAASFGLCLFVIPGIAIYCALAVTMTSVVAAGKGLGAALDESQRLTQGSRVSLFAAFVAVAALIVAVAALVAMGIGIAMFLVTQDAELSGIAAGVLGIVLVVLGNPVFSLVAPTFYRLRAEPERVDAPDVAQVFA